MSKLGTTALLLVVAISASDAQACGEVMYRMGGALRYHAFITRHPAEILLYNGTAAQQAATADSQRFHENLEKAGHKVTVVDGPEALTNGAPWAFELLRARGNSIEGGTTEVLKNIVAERVLGLPRLR